MFSCIKIITIIGLIISGIVLDITGPKGEGSVLTFFRIFIRIFIKRDSGL